MTRTDKPARARMTAAVRPLGRLPTTVTSTTPVDSIRRCVRSLPAPNVRGLWYRRGHTLGCNPVSLPVVLIADKLAESTVAALGDQVEVRWVDGPDRPKLLAAVADADALLVRSANTVDA